ncbi:MAG: M28 family peptidase [Chloroflexi bacterium]|nr:M28 family peptidase [Chloroflexota bacterium]
MFSAAAALAHATHLSTAIGPRPAGLASSSEAASYIAATLASYGYEVERQDFSFPSFEERRVSVMVSVPPGATTGATGSAAAGGAEPVEAHALLYSGSGTVSGRLALAGFGRPEDYAAPGMEGAIALVERGAGLTFREKAEAAAAAGVAAVIIYNNTPRLFVGSLQAPMPVPVLAISGRDGARLGEQALRGTVQATVDVDVNVAELQTENIVGRRRAGQPAAGRTIVAGAHYDSVQVSPGANDNASGTAVLLELARVLSHEPLGVDLTLIAFGAEELGLLGSAHFVGQLNRAETGRVAAMLNFDMVGVGDELLAGGTSRLVQLTQEIGEARGVRVGRMGDGFANRSDHAPFLAAGVPSIFFSVMDDPNYHTADDRAEHISARRLEEVGAIGAQLIRRLARGG